MTTNKRIAARVEDQAPDGADYVLTVRRLAAAAGLDHAAARG